jgi:hypothetical protein
MEEQEYLNIVKKSINKINTTWTKDQIILLKSELETLKISKKDFDYDIPLSNLKKDVLIDLLLNPGIKANSNDIKLLKIENCSAIPLMKGIQFINPKNKREYIFDKKFIKHKILNNIGIINFYYLCRDNCFCLNK